jgi:hypothetical protein
MRDVIGLILFFGLVGLVQVLFVNALWKAARKDLPKKPEGWQELAALEPGKLDSPPTRRRLPALLLRWLPAR